jgi:uncharacterized membrane protein
MQEMQRSNENWYDFITDTSTNVGGTERMASMIAGGALLGFGIKQGGLIGTAASVLGGAMLYRGSTGHCHVYDAMDVNTVEDVPEGTRKSPFNRSLFTSRVHVTKSVTINKPAAELYSFWRNFENLPQFMKHLESVTVTGDKTSHWKAKAPLGSSVEWDAELTSDIENKRIGWKSVENATIPNSGVVEFIDAGNRGTIVKAVMTYEAPGGKVGEWIAWALGEEPSFQVEDDLLRFKRLMETGRIPTTDGQTSGRERYTPQTRTAKA